MGSDRARITYDPHQHYRSVVMQQGRVTLEADWNEAQQISEEELRRETLDIVGPAGTPDDGYRVVIPPPSTSLPYDFLVEKGTMYVGGVRTWLGEPVHYSNQPEWRDPGPEDPDWVDPVTLAAPPANEFIYLLLREQEVSAVEDQDLKDVALGGPDTVQRTRLLQRFVRLASQGADCVSGLAAAQAHWLTEGLVFHPDIMRLISSGRLSVGAANQQPAPNPCLPQAQGGYVDPDNQLIRVQISGVDSLTGNPKFLWGFDDASFLYRIDVDPNNPQNLLLQSAPVDSFHQPVRGQAVEVLRVAAELSNGGLVAALSGFPFTLDQNYDPDAQSVLLPTGVSLPPDYLSATQSPPTPLFLRVWQEEKVFAPGVATVLGDTGLEVTLETASGGPFHTGDYWMFAVRPSTPQTVYPERYWNNFQPAEGPRLWACPLAVLSWIRRTGFVAADCRNSFGNLVNLNKRQGGCCTITIKPRDLSPTRTLQSILDAASNLSLQLTAVQTGAIGNNIAVSVANVRSDLSPATFDVTVTETETYSALSVGQIESVLGDERTNSPTLAHQVTASVSQDPNAVPAAQTVSFADTSTPSARADFYSSAGAIVFTLEARGTGDGGNFTTATVANINTTVSPNTFDLTLTWTRTLTSLNVGNCVPAIQFGLGYEVNVAGAQAGISSVPAEGVTQFSGGLDSSQTAPATSATANLFGGPVKLCLSPGAYYLPQTLQISNTLSHLTIEACGGGATLAAMPGSENLFDQGLITITGTNGITLRDLTFKMPALQPLNLNVAVGNFDRAFVGARSSQATGATASIAIRPIDCQSLTIEGCTFNYPLTVGRELACAAIFSGGQCLGLQLRGNQFNGPANFLAAATTAPLGDLFVFGYVHVGAAASASGSVLAVTVTGAVLDDAWFVNNTFQNVFFATYVLATAGEVVFDGNIIATCPLGLVLGTMEGLGAFFKLPEGQASNASSLAGFSREFTQAVMPQALAVAASYPLPAAYRPRNTVALPATQADASPAVSGPTRVLQSLATAAEIGYFPSPLPTTSLRIGNNDINTILSPTLGGSTAVLLLGNEKNINSSLLMYGNRIRSRSATAATVSITGIPQSIITGNLIQNQQPAIAGVPAPPSLQVTGSVAVTGNILRGQSTIPQRNATLPYGIGTLAAPMDRWEAYNTEV
jgi:hypothetical protein